MIHKTAIVHPKAEIDEGVEIGPYSIIDENVRIGRGTIIGPHVIIKKFTRIGKNCNIYQFASIGEIPQDQKFAGEETELIIGDNNIIREFVTLNRGTKEGGGKTLIGNNNFLMAYSHVAHDCYLGNNVIMANAATLAGHITIEDYAIIGGLSAIHQFVRIGAYSLVGGASAVSQDVPPYCLAVGNRAKLYGLNLIGLKRRNFPSEIISALKSAYRIIFKSNLKLKDAIKKVEYEIKDLPEIKTFIDFLKNSKRGFCR